MVSSKLLEQNVKIWQCDSKNVIDSTDQYLKKSKSKILISGDLVPISKLRKTAIRISNSFLYFYTFKTLLLLLKK